MLTCVHSPIDKMRVVEQDEALKLYATGVWFDCPNKAKQYREKVESELPDETPKRAKKEKIK